MGGARASSLTTRDDGVSSSFVKEEDMPSPPVVKEEALAPLMPPDAYVKVEVVVKEEERSGSRPKRQRAK